MSEDWVPIETPDGAADLKSYRASFQLPFYYERPERGSFKLHVLKVCKGRPTNHLIMLAGGPGQKGNYYFHRIRRIARLAKNNFVIYLPTHRGIGRSGKIASSKVVAAWQNLDGDRAKGIPPLDAITVTNAARDIVELAKTIRTGADFRQSSRLHLYGCSYGGLWGTRVLQVAPANHFDTFLMNSPLVLKHFLDPLNDREFLKACQDDPFCRGQVSGDAGRIRNVASYVGNPAFNECTMKFHEMLQTVMQREGGKSGRRQESWARLHLYIQKLHNNGIRESMAALALLNHLYKCPSGPFFATEIAPTLFSLYHHPGMLGLGDNGVASDSALGCFGDSSSINTLVNIHILSTELYGIGSGAIPAECQPVSPLGVFSDCAIFWGYRERFESHLKHHAPPPDRLGAAPLDAGATKIYIFHSTMDALTPFPAVEAFFNEIRGPFKRMLISKDLEHSGLLKSDCAQFVFSEVLHGGSPSVTDACLSSKHGQGPDWRFLEHPFLEKLWLSPEVNQLKELPPTPNFRVSVSLKSSLPLASSMTGSQAPSLYDLLVYSLVFLALGSILLLGLRKLRGPGVLKS